MKNRHVIKGVALFLLLIGTYSIIMQIFGFYSFGKLVIDYGVIGAFFWFSIWSLFIPFLFSIFFLLGSYLLFKMRNLGRVLVNIVLFLDILYYSSEFIIMGMINNNKTQINGWYVFYHFSWHWDVIVIPILFLFILVFINIRIIRNELVT